MRHNNEWTTPLIINAIIEFNILNVFKQFIAQFWTALYFISIFLIQVRVRYFQRILTYCNLMIELEHYLFPVMFLHLGNVWFYIFYLYEYWLICLSNIFIICNLIYCHVIIVIIILIFEWGHRDFAFKTTMDFIIKPYIIKQNSKILNISLNI